MAPSKGLIEELANIDQRLSALEAKFDSFSNEQKDGSNKRKKPAWAAIISLNRFLGPVDEYVTTN